MPKKITEITEEQASRFDEWVDKWTAIGLSTEPADFERAENAALKAYDLCGLERPVIVLRSRSPYEATVKGIMAWKKIQSGNTHDQPVDISTDEWSSGSSNYRGGSLWASWCAYVSFMRDVMKWENPILEQFTIDEELTLSCGWIWWHESILVISDRPKSIHMDAKNNLHNENGPAILYRDGWGIYSWHGVTIPAEYVEDRSFITPERIRKERNAELKRVMLEIYGYDRWISEIGAKILHQDTFGILYSIDHGDNLPPTRLVAVDDPSTSHRYFLKVHPDIKTARAAVASTFPGMDEASYCPVAEA